MALDQLDKQAIQDLLNNTQRIQQNVPIINRLQALLQAKSVMKDHFTYTANFLALAGAGVVTVNVAIQADADFLIQAQAEFTDIATAIQTDSSRVIPVCTVLLTDSGSGRQFMDSDVPVPSIFGTGSLPFVLPQPKLISARGNITVKVTNLTAATTYNLRLAFIGVKLFAL